MAKTIYKYPIADTSYIDGVIHMPRKAKILALQVQQDIPCIWAEVDPDAPREVRVFRTIGTGHAVPDGTYIGTYQQGIYVWHVYEVKS